MCEPQPIETVPRNRRVCCWVPWPDRPAWQTGIFYNGLFWADHCNGPTSVFPSHWIELPNIFRNGSFWVDHSEGTTT